VGRWEERWLQAKDLCRVQEERARQVQATDQEERARQVQVLRAQGRVLMETARQRVVVQMEKARALAVDPLVARGKGRLRSRERIRLQCCLRA
jgi:hypothetical protein